MGVENGPHEEEEEVFAEAAPHEVYPRIVSRLVTRSFGRIFSPFSNKQWPKTLQPYGDHAKNLAEFGLKKLSGSFRATGKSGAFRNM